MSRCTLVLLLVICTFVYIHAAAVSSERKNVAESVELERREEGDEESLELERRDEGDEEPLELERRDEGDEEDDETEVARRDIELDETLEREVRGKKDKEKSKSKKVKKTKKKSKKVKKTKKKKKSKKVKKTKEKKKKKVKKTKEKKKKKVKKTKDKKKKVKKTKDKKKKKSRDKLRKKYRDKMRKLKQKGKKLKELMKKRKQRKKKRKRKWPKKPKRKRGKKRGKKRKNRKRKKGKKEKLNQDLCSCRGQGDPHYHTFDHQIIHFMGICRYILAQSTIPPAQDNCAFTMEVINENRKGNKRVSYAKNAYISIRGHNIKLGKGKVVTVDGEVVDFGRNGRREYSGGVEVKMSRRYVIVSVVECEFTGSFDGSKDVRVSVPRIKYGSKLQGICGNCDGNKANDLITKDGKDVSGEKGRGKFTLIGDSWKSPVQGPDAPDNCQSGTPTIPPMVDCTGALLAKAESADYCGKLKDVTATGPFSDCINMAQDIATEFFNSCVMDVCQTEGEDGKREIACSNLAEFSDKCAEVGGVVDAWRGKNCPLKCGENEEYDTVVSSCPATCEEPDAEEFCNVPDTEGCQCKEGFLMLNNKCVPANSKECSKESGDTCNCYGWGDPHYKTYDEKFHNFQETGMYILTSASAEEGAGRCEFEVTVENERRPDQWKPDQVTWTRQVNTAVLGSVVSFIKGDIVAVDGDVVANFPFKVGNMTIVNEDENFRLDVPDCLLSVSFDGDNMILVRAAKDLYGGKLSGICGNCDADPANDTPPSTDDQIEGPEEGPEI